MRPDTHGKCAPHFHVTYAIGLGRSGGGTVFALGKTWTYRANMLVVTNPFDAHWGRPSADGLDYRLFYPCPEWLTALPALQSCPSATWFNRAVYDDPQLLVQFAEAFDQLEFYQSDGAAANALNALFAKYARRIDGESGLPHRPPVNGASLDAESNGSVARLAAKSGLSRAHFSREYRRCLGLSPLHHRRQLRVIAARSLIKGGSSLADAAAAAGFADQAHMTRQFRQILGVTPGAYRPNG